MKIKFKNTTQLEFVFLQLSNFYDNVSGKEAEEEKIDGDSTEEDNESLGSINSPILSDKDIIFHGKKQFDEVCSWSLDSVNLDRILNENLIELSIIKYWVLNKIICPLLEKDKMDEFLKLDYRQTIEYIKKLKQDQLNDLSNEILKNDSTEIKQTEWDYVCRKIGIELCTRLGLLRLGKQKIKNSPRIWIGRNQLAFSSKRVYKAHTDHYFDLGENFVKTFLGNRAFDKKWTLSYRGCLWRFTEFFANSKLCTYVEEFESEDVI